MQSPRGGMYSHLWPARCTCAYAGSQCLAASGRSKHENNARGMRQTRWPAAACAVQLTPVSDSCCSAFDGGVSVLPLELVYGGIQWTGRLMKQAHVHVHVLVWLTG